MATGNICPHIDGGADLGRKTKRWKTIHAGNLNDTPVADNGTASEADYGLVKLATQKEIDNSSSGAFAVTPHQLNGAIADAHDPTARQNIALLAFRQAVQGELSVQKMIDGIVDEYEDTTGLASYNGWGFLHSGAYLTSAGYPSYNKTGSGTPSGSPPYSATYDAYRAFDHADIEGWLTSSGPPVFIAYDFGAGNEFVLDYYTIQLGNLANSTARAPNTWDVLGSNDGTNWDVIGSESGVTWSVDDEIKGFSVDNAVAYRHYRLYITANNGDSRVGFGEWAMFSRESASPNAVVSGENVYSSLQSGTNISLNSDLGTNRRNSSYRILVNLPNLTGSQSALKVQFRSGTNGTCVVKRAFVGVQAAQGNPWDFEPGTRTQLYFDGQESYTTSVGEVVLSDLAELSFDGSDTLVVSFDFGDEGLPRISNTSGYSNVYRLQNVDAAEFDSPLAFTLDSSWQSMFVDDVHAASITDTQGFQADTAPEELSVVLFEEDDGSVALNTDIVASVSRDGGTTWTQVPLADSGEYEVGKHILTGIADVRAQPAGNACKYKVQIFNNKTITLHGASLQWR